MYDIIIGRDEKDRKKFGTEGTVFLGRQYIQMGRTTSMANNIHLDVTRAHVVFICGKRGGGKCLYGDTLITLADGSQVPIKDLENDKRQVRCINDQFRLTTASKTQFYKREVHELFELTLKTGKKIKLTPEHPLLTPVGWIPASEAGKTKIATPKKNQTHEVRDEKTGQVLLLKTDIYWDEIIETKELRGTFTVYDISVPQCHNFIANDIIVHNSYTMGAISEGMADLAPKIKQNLAFILLDTMGIYWTMKYPNKQDELLLAEWNFKPKALDVKIFTPYKYYEQYKKEGIPTDFPFSINAYELDSGDWQMTFDVSANEPVGVLIERIIHDLQDNGVRFTVDDIIKVIQKDEHCDQNTKDAAINRFLTCKGWGVFAEKGEGTPLHQLAIAGTVAVLDVSCYATMPGGWKIKHLIVGIVAQKLFVYRMLARKTEEFKSVKSAIHYFSEDVAKEKLDMPMVWLVIDEAHEFLPREGKNPATDPLVTILREGRQPGISLILATQQPGKIHTDVMTQSDTVLSHRITAKMDVDALSMLMQSYMREGLDVQLNNLPRMKGAAVLFDDTNERLYQMQIRPRFTWHGGSSPTALKEEKKGV